VGTITAKAVEPDELSRTNLEFRLRLLVARHNMNGGNQTASERTPLVCHGLSHEGGQKEAMASGRGGLGQRWFASHRPPTAGTSLWQEALDRARQ
jgi:hypothetical protein